MLLGPAEARGGLSREANAGMLVLYSLIPDPGWFDDVGRSLPVCVDRVRGLRARAIIILITILSGATRTRCARYPGLFILHPFRAKRQVVVMTVRLVAYLAAMESYEGHHSHHYTEWRDVDSLRSLPGATLRSPRVIHIAPLQG